MIRVARLEKWIQLLDVTIEDDGQPKDLPDQDRVERGDRGERRPIRKLEGAAIFAHATIIVAERLSCEPPPAQTKPRNNITRLAMIAAAEATTIVTIA